ncbi:helix-turn-helix transcriptional regulator [Nitrospina gracilis]|nr:helix-turn-helix transcriptional regulator [Nitrospina gracilis]
MSPQAYRLTKEKGLSEREIEISLLVLAGKSKEEISIELYISKFTVDTHIKHIYKKMNVNSLSQFIKEFNSI